MQITDPVSQHVRLVGSQKAALEKLGITTIQDLLNHIPSRYEDIGAATPIAHIPPNELVTVYGELHDVEKKLNWKTKRYMVEGWLHDATGKIKVRWFNMPYIAEKLQYTNFVKVTGKASGKQSLSFINPITEDLPGLPELDNLSDDTQLYPIYPTSYGVSSRWFYYTVRKILATVSLDEYVDIVPETIFARYNLPSMPVALQLAHLPRTASEAQVARKRFAFNEVFFLQLANAQQRALTQTAPTHELNDAQQHIANLLSTFPFALTGAQEKAVAAIIHDMATPGAMLRLLEGDVGTGKTAVAALISYATIKTRPKGQDFGTLQVAYMAPTEVLAEQLFKSFCDTLKNTGVTIALMTGSGCKKFPSKSDGAATKISRTQLLKWMANGEVSIVIGTHALIQDSVQFKHLALAIIDEQHRFGTRQRAKLVTKDEHLPHLLSMTATPIPRTLALTIYGDLDLTVLDEYPKGRKQVITKLISNTDKQRQAAYTHIQTELTSGRQAYVICPKVAPSDLSTKDGKPPSQQKLMMARVKSVAQEQEQLAKVFPKAHIAGLHGKMTASEKETVMRDFAQGSIDILVATSVVEVGVNVPNATNILIEGAERFGLSQLHQLRGRVLRSTHQAYCFLCTTGSMSENTKARLQALTNAKDGFELAEIDLKLRGAGELSGDKQWGMSDVAMEALQNLKMVEAARTEAQRLIADDPQLVHHAALKKHISATLQHLE